MKTGKIVIGIDQKVYFEYYELEKPNLDDYKNVSFLPASYLYFKAIEKYEASKQLIEVDNVLYQYKEKHKVYYIIIDINKYFPVYHNTSCKAEVEDTAIIVELN